MTAETASLFRNDRERFELDSDRAYAWLNAIVTATDESSSLSEEYDSPSSADLYLSSDWKSNSRQAINDVKILLWSAQELGILLGPTVWGSHIVVEENDGEDCYMWVLNFEQYANIQLVSHEYELRNLGGSGIARGAEAAINVLLEFVDQANRLLTNLEEAAALVLAKTSRDGVLVSRLADSPSFQVSAYAVNNPVCPDDGKTLAAFRHRLS
jgi:hypothetical protein